MQVNDEDWLSLRHRTAIVRPDLSKPMRRGLLDDVINQNTSVLDYGCGRGHDVSRLQQMGITAVGWDPHFAPDTPLEPHDVVTLNYVLNVVEKTAEREKTLRTAWALAKRVLVVSSRLIWERNNVAGEVSGDGVLTRRTTFQHLYRSSELRSYVENGVGAKCVSPVPGIVYAFKKNEDRLAYIARGTISEFRWEMSADYAAAVTKIVAFAEQRGRPPQFEELPPDVVPLLGRFSRKTVSRIIETDADTKKLAAATRKATLETLLYLGTSLFSGRAPLVDLPVGVQADIRHCFGSYREACRRADRLLAKIRDDAYVRGAMQNSPGKLTASALYVHRRTVESMPVVLRLYEYCGFIAAGRPDDWNILKLDHRGRRVSWSAYPEFESDPHPRLAWTFGVDMTSRESRFQDFSERTNRPLLHRKEEFLGPNDPSIAKYRRLTDAEVRAGLYQNPTLIGLEDGWEAELVRCGVMLKGHRLIKRR